MGTLLLISEEFRRCHSLFKDLYSEVTSHNNEVPGPLWLEQLGRLRIWSANIAAHQTTQASLDHRLRDASHIKIQIVNLLRSIEHRIEEVGSILHDKQSDQTVPASDTDIEDIRALHDLEAVIPPSEDSSDQQETTTDIQECFDVIVNAIGCLYQVSMLVKTPARHDRLIDLDIGVNHVFREFDERHVSDKFPRADPVVVRRLGNAITQRRHDLDRRRRHQAKLRRGLDEEGEELGLDTLSDTNATTFLPHTIDLDDTLSVAAMSTTSIADSLIQAGTARIPPLPTHWDGEHGFECDYCGLPNVVVRNRAEWTSHVLKDLYPYVCLHETCATPNLMYDSRRVWFAHMLSSHTSPPKEPVQGVLLQHLPQALTCPLCRDELEGRKSQNHIARHLQELALWSLPQQVVDDDGGDEDKNFSDDSSGDHDSEFGGDIEAPNKIHGREKHGGNEDKNFNAADDNNDVHRSKYRDDATTASQSYGREVYREYSDDISIIDSPTKPWIICPYCQRMFEGRDRKGNLKRHINSLHPPERYRCKWGICPKHYHRRDELLMHVKLEHTHELTVFVCLWSGCDMHFNDKYFLENHVENHVSRAVRERRR